MAVPWGEKDPKEEASFEREAVKGGGANELRYTRKNREKRSVHK